MLKFILRSCLHFQRAIDENKHEIRIGVHYTVVSTAQMVKENKK